MTEPTPETTITSVKGFNRDWTCRDFQFAVGQTYQHHGKVEACAGGFHACEYPLDVFSYYPPGTSRYAEVVQSGEIARHDDDTKIASSHLTVVAELSLHDVVERAVQWVFGHAKPENTNHATGYRGAASATGYQGRVMGASGNALFLVYRDPDTGEILHVWAGIAGRQGIKPETWYTLDDAGKPVPVGEQVG